MQEEEKLRNLEEIGKANSLFSYSMYCKTSPEILIANIQSLRISSSSGTILVTNFKEFWIKSFVFITKLEMQTA